VAAPEVDPKELPRLPAVPADQALATFKLRPGLKLERVAAEPLVRDPIEVCFDENGRMFVVEMIDYSEMRDAKPHLGRISMLEDTDGDGVFDRSTVFVDDLPWPTGIFWANGGLYVAATPDIFFCKDTNGDGRADTRTVVFTGFGLEFAPYRIDKLNMQAMLNSLRWGLDNRIHGLTAPNGGDITSPFTPNAKPVSVRRRDFVIEPRTNALTTEAGGGQYGLAFDDTGRRYTCNNSDHLRVFLYDGRYESRNPFYTAMPPPLQSIAADGPTAEVYRTSPDEPWRLIRTKWRVTGATPGMVEGGGRASGYFTSATGLMVYRGNAIPPEFVGDVFVADCGSNLVHHKKVRADGLSLVGERPADEQRTEFLTSTDTWFRPVQMANAPDGSLYIIDMYREIIEHPWSLPPTLKKHLDLNSGNDRGRIYRVVPEGFRSPAPPRLGSASVAELVRTLAHPNGWHRDTAARLLYERQDKSAVPLLEQLLSHSGSPLGRLHALWAIEGQGALRAEHVLRGLDDVDERVRVQAVILSERFIAGGAPSPLSTRVMALAADPALAVRWQVAFSLGEMKSLAVVPPLAAIVARDAGESWMRGAVLSSLAVGTGDMFRAVVARIASAAEKDRPPLQSFVKELVEVIGARNDAAEVAAVLDYAVGATDPALAFALVHGLGAGLQRAKVALPAERVRPLIERAERLASDRRQPDAARVQAVELLALTPYAACGPRLLAVLVPGESPPVQVAALRTLGRFPDPGLGAEITKRWNILTPRLRNDAIALLVARRERLTALLDAAEAQVIRRTELASPQIDALMNYREPAIKARAIKLLAARNASTREDVIKAFHPALALPGDATKGRKTFVERCALCHRMDGEGHALGPDLVSVRNSGREKLMIGILDPNREVLAQYSLYEIETKDGETQAGILGHETPTSITLRLPFSQEVIVPRANIASMRSRGQSMMPELEGGLSPQDMADLLEFIATAKQ
jgi:putative membrane-bound dehydrogenase-like protein